MRPTRIVTRLLAGLTLLVALESQALAAGGAGAPAAPLQAAPAATSPRASLRLDIAPGKAWVDRALPITVTAYFRDVDGVTLEGAPQIGSSGLFTSELSGEPRQATQVVRGEPMLVATWTGTLTPISPGALDVSVQLPVRLRYHVSAPRVDVGGSLDEDAFDALAADPFDPSFMSRFLNQAMVREPPAQRHEEDVSLRAAGRALEALPLPSKDRPASFTGAIGRFDLSASVSSTKVALSEPVTLRVVVAGDGDLDRVELAGVPTSDTWKTYPPKASIEPGTKRSRARKVFEQVLVPLHGGTLSIPPVLLSAFDPALERYTTRESAPLAVTVDGAPLPPGVTPEVAPLAASLTTSPSPTAADEPPQPELQTVPLAKLGARLAPVPIVIALAYALARSRRLRAARSLRTAMRATAQRGDALPFYRAARSLIEERLAERWGVSPAEVSPSAIEHHLGRGGDALAAAILADEALRFGRGRLDQSDLVATCSTIEQSLRAVS